MSTTLTAPVVLDDDVRAPSTGWPRVLVAARLQTLNWGGALVWPWAILLSAWVINWLIFGVLETDAEGTTGGLASIYIVSTLASLTTIAQFLPFSLGLGLTRRSFYAGAVLVALTQALLNGVLLLLGKGLEDLTGGWGVDMRFFAVSWLDVGNPLLQVFVYAAPFLLFSGAGLLWASFQQRWGVTGTYVMLIGGVIVGGLALMLVQSLNGWSAIGDFFSGTPIGVTAGVLPLGLGAAFALAGFGVVRGTTV